MEHDLFPKTGTHFSGGEPSPHFSHSMWPAPVQEADRAGAARRAMWDIGQARRRTLLASSTGPLGCLSAGISSVGRLNRMPRYAFRRPTLYLPRRKSNAGRMECEKCGLACPDHARRAPCAVRATARTGANAEMSMALPIKLDHCVIHVSDW